MGWKTPLVVTTIVRKEKMPTWYPPKSVREAHLKEDGDVLPGAVPPGPDNPLGQYALRLGIPGGAYLIHGTNKPVGVGMQITHGCIRLYPEDIERLYGEVRTGTTVRIVNQRIKTGWRDGALYLEVHPPLFAGEPRNSEQADELTRTIVAATARQRVPIDWDTGRTDAGGGERRPGTHLNRRSTCVDGRPGDKPPGPLNNRQKSAAIGIAAPQRPCRPGLLGQRLLEHAVDFLVYRIDIC
ncbi:MAG: L,D-transpeptidase family protein [Steroidobacteraceae bacterium]